MDEAVIKSEIEQGIAQVDDTLTIDEFTCNLDNENRKLNVYFTAKNSDDETVKISNSWG